MHSTKFRNLQFLSMIRRKKKIRIVSSQKRYQQTVASDAHTTDIPVQSSGLVQFDDYKTVFEYKETSEIIRALFVLKLCSIDTIVNNGEKVG